MHTIPRSSEPVVRNSTSDQFPDGGYGLVRVGILLTTEFQGYMRSKDAPGHGMP